MFFFWCYRGLYPVNTTLRELALLLWQDSEDASEEQLAEQAMTVLRRLFGKGIPAPTAVAATKWASDPYAKGKDLIIPPSWFVLRADCRASKYYVKPIRSNAV